MGVVGKGVDGVEAHAEPSLLADLAAADNCDNWYVAGSAGDHRGEFAFQGLDVHLALTGDHEIAAP